MLAGAAILVSEPASGLYVSVVRSGFVVRISGGRLPNGVFRARVSSPREPLVIHLTSEIRTHPRCRNGRTTFTRRNWPSKQNATTVSRYFPFSLVRGREMDRGDNLAGSSTRNRETDLHPARSIRVSRVASTGSSLFFPPFPLRSHQRDPGRPSSRLSGVSTFS